MSGLDAVIDNHRIVICAGPGGVGKTTVAAALALDAARRGRRACVVTIDPARRLADALGLAELTNEPTPVEFRSADSGAAGGGLPGGELWALMLDTKATFDEVVTRYAADDAQAQFILANGLYRNISGALGGTQEYMAMEKLHQLVGDGRFDLVVVDTPPTRNALDFIDAPERLTRFLNNRFFRLLMTPTRAGLRAVNVATQVFLRTISRVIGREVVTDAVAFFTAFEGMEQGFRERSERMSRMLGDPATAFVVVAAPRRDAVDEAVYFADRLKQSAIGVKAVVVNRVVPRWGPVPDIDADPGTPLGALVANLRQLDDVGRREQRHIETLAARTPGAVLVRVPYLDDDVHDVLGLVVVAGYLRQGPSEP